MKKSVFLIYLFFIVTFIFISCDKDTNPIDSYSECQNNLCTEIITDFLIKISVSMTPYDNNDFDLISDSENFLGVHNEATDSYDDQYDILDPPVGVGSWVKLYFPHPEWNHNLGDNFTQDIKGNIFSNFDNRIKSWVFNVESNISGTININFEPVSDYCYNCIDSIILTTDDETYSFSSIENADFNISKFLQSNNILSFNLSVVFLDSI